MEQPYARQDFEISYLRAAGFDVAGIAHGFFGRQGGFSTGIFEGLNCGVGSGDDAELVKANRALAASTIGARAENLISLYQIHSATCLNIAAAFGGERPQGDAMVTDVPGLALSILTADCAPVLFRGEGKDGRPVIGAAHAGWRGAIGGVLESVVAMMMRDYDVDVKTIRAAIGPCIHKKSYEVSGEFYETFMGEDPANECFFQQARKDGHFMFDLPGYCAARLGGCGVRQVAIAGKDSYEDEAEYYSFRRATHRGEGDYGRQISMVMISP